MSNTWTLNFELLENLVAEKSDWKDLSTILNGIKTKFEKKKQLRSEVSKIKGKILIEKQIIEEFKRKIDENEEYYKDQLKEYDENIVNKEEYIKIFEKKLKEVEIYIQKNTKNNPNSKFEPYKDFKISEFIEVNTELMRRREVLRKDLNSTYKLRDDMERENLQFKSYKKRKNFVNEGEEREEYFSFEEDEKKGALSIYHNDICVIEDEEREKAKEESKRKLRELYNFYKNEMKVMSMRNQMMKSYFSRVSSKMRYFNTKESKKFILS